MKKLSALLGLCSLVFGLCAGARAASDFEAAAQMLSAARAGDIQYVQRLVNDGADVNYVDNTGLSIVCTALMNNDIRAAQILQAYGADASKCDQQIKQFKNKKPKEESGGLFSGLSTAQSMTLTAAGAAAVVFGLVYLTDAIGSGNRNAKGSTGGDRPSTGNTGSSSGGTPSSGTTLPAGPAPAADYANNLNGYNPNTNDYRKWDFAYMTGRYANPADTNFGQTITDSSQPNYGQENYLLMMHGYSPLARGYQGLETVRVAGTNAPYDLSKLPLPPDSIPGGGKPAAVSLITASGINPAGSAADGQFAWLKESEMASLISVCTQYGSSSSECSAKIATAIQTSRKYYNYANLTDTSEKAGFDLSGFGSVFNKYSDETDLAKIIAGWYDGTRATGDLSGFLPYGQLVIYRTGGGKEVSKTIIGNYTDATGDGLLNSNDTITVNSDPYTITLNPDNTFSATGASGTFAGYIGADGFLHINNSNEIYALVGNEIRAVVDADYKNFHAIRAAAQLDINTKGIIANASIVPSMRDNNTKTMSGIVGVVGTSDKINFENEINKHYMADPSSVGGTVTLANTPGGIADDLFYNVGRGSYSPLLIFSAGEFAIDDAPRYLDATFENYAPILYNNLEHLFMTVVAVQKTDGTLTPSLGAGGINSYKNSNIGLAAYAANGTKYASRSCGMAGTGTSAADPWCFAAAGANGQQAVASMAGAAGAVKGAFGYMTNQQLFMLLALTADGYLLGSKDISSALPGSAEYKTALVEYLKNMYVMPAEYENRWKNLGEDYLKVFAEVFGYGLVNLERATTSGTTMHYYNGNSGKIVSTSGNAYWRAAANSVFSTSRAFGARTATIAAPAYDLLESADGSMAMPRVWDNEFSLGTDGRRGLYMGDLLGEFATSNEHKITDIGGLTAKISFSESSRSQNLNGLDELSLGYASGDWTFGAGFQSHASDRTNMLTRGDRSNPIFGLASNIVVNRANYRAGNWTFGAGAFSGTITDETLLANDPAISSRYEPETLGRISGAETSVGYGPARVSFGSTHETDTILGAHTGGMFALGGGDTTYIDAQIDHKFGELSLFGRATFARTSGSASGLAVMDLSAIESNAWSVGADWRGWSFGVSQPLVISRGNMEYAGMNYKIVESANGYDIETNPYAANLNLSPDARETRMQMAYRTQLGPATNGAFGFIYRINPNHTRDYGNESILMFKAAHKLGI